MKQEKEAQPAYQLYSGYLEGAVAGEVAERLWGKIPANMAEAYRALPAVRRGYGEAPEGIEDLKKAMKDQIRGLGFLTSRVSEGIDRLENGVVESGHQPICLGGPSLILNKIACIRSLCDLGGDGFVPLFYVADYDGVQAELLNTRVPSTSPRGLLMAYPSGPEHKGSPINALPNPPEEWLRETFERIEGNYRGFMRDLDGRVQERALANLAHSMTVLRGGYYSTGNVSDWSARVLGSLVDLEADLGVPMISPSAQELRPHFQQGYELLLSEPNRGAFIEASNGAVALLEGAGYRPQIGRRTDDYVPFFLECPTKGCNRTRVELKYRRQHGSSIAEAYGKCPTCGEVHEFSFDAGSPDLSDVIDRISPRVDSRQVVVDSAIPVLAHVGGPGETGYYAEVIPGARALGVPFPVFVRYTRTFYNTPWNEGYAAGLRERGLPTLMNDDLFGALGLWVEARKGGDGRGIAEAHSEIKRSIEDVDQRLLERRRILEAEIEGIKEGLRAPGDRGALIGELRRKQGLSRMIETYLSSALGRFAPERFGQEVSWSWLDLAAVTGLGDLMGVYLRLYDGLTPNSSIYFVNVRLPP